eukprot:scaffold48723_cov292-Isochrysis_galbana.AAC.2
MIYDALLADTDTGPAAEVAHNARSRITKERPVRVAGEQAGSPFSFSGLTLHIQLYTSVKQSKCELKLAS